MANNVSAVTSSIMGHSVRHSVHTTAHVVASIANLGLLQLQSAEVFIIASDSIAFKVSQCIGSISSAENSNLRNLRLYLIRLHTSINISNS